MARQKNNIDADTRDGGSNKQTMFDNDECRDARPYVLKELL
ncbi:MAG: hypothetical protein QM654_11565 [Dysgonamonadaceae bacterium]